MTPPLAIQLRKEARALLPWAVAVGTGTAALAFLAGARSGFLTARHEQLVWLLIAHVTGVLAVAALSLGHELTHGTLANLLVQPIDRRRVLAIKLAVAAATLVALGTLAEFAFPTFSLSGHPLDRLLIIWGPVAAGLGLVPVLTLLTQKPLAGVVFSMTIPLLMLLAGPYFIPLRQSHLALAATWYGTLAVSAAGAVGLWLLFPRLEIAGTSYAREAAAEVAVPVEATAGAVRAGRHWVWQLIRKETRLQQMTLAVSGLYVLAGAAILIAERLNPIYVGPAFGTVSYAHAFFIVLIAGSLASAEERHLGTLTGQTLQPIAAWRQWIVKSGVTLGLSCLLALLLPLALMSFHRPSGPFVLDEELPAGLVMIGIAALYVSSISSNSLWALLASFPAIAGSVLIAGGVINPIVRLGRRQFAAFWSTELVTPAMQTDIADPGWRTLNDSLRLHRVVEETVLIGLAAGLALLIWHLAGRNHCTVDRSARRIRRQLATMAAYVALGAIVYVAALRTAWGLVRP